MKRMKVFITVCLVAFGFTGISHGGHFEGNGGDSIVLSFSNALRSVSNLFRPEGGGGALLPHVASPQWSYIVDAANLDVESRPTLTLNGREVEAINYTKENRPDGNREKNLILVNRSLWPNLSFQRQVVIVAHEILTLLGYQDSQFEMSSLLQNVPEHYLRNGFSSRADSLRYARRCGWDNGSRTIDAAIVDCQYQIGSWYTEFDYIGLNQSWTLLSVPNFIFLDSTFVSEGRIRRNRLWKIEQTSMMYYSRNNTYVVANSPCRAPWHVANTHELRNALNRGFGRLPQIEHLRYLSVKEDNSSAVYAPMHLDLQSGALVRRPRFTFESFGGNVALYRQTEVACVLDL